MTRIGIIGLGFMGRMHIGAYSKVPGATLVAISPQTPDASLTLAEKHSLAYPVLSDLGNVVTRRFGIEEQLEACRCLFDQHVEAADRLETAVARRADQWCLGGICHHIEDPTLIRHSVKVATKAIAARHSERRRID